MNKKCIYFLLSKVIVITFIFVFYYLNCKTPLLADDYSYSFVWNTAERIDSLVDVLRSTVIHYSAQGGRFTSCLLSNLFLLLGKQAFNIVNTLGYIVFILLITVHSKPVGKKTKILGIILTNIFLWLFIPRWGECFLWVVGSANYLWGMILILLILLPYRNNLLGLDSRLYSKWYFSIIMGIGGVLAAGTNENTAAALLFMVVALLLYYFFSKKTIKSWMIFGACGILIGFLLMVNSPGNAQRISNASDNTLPILEILIYRIINYSEIAVKYLIIPLMVLFVFMILANQTKAFKKMEFAFLIFYFTGMLTSVYSMTLSPEFPGRAWFGAIIFLTIMLNFSFNWLQIKDILSKGISAVLCLIMFFQLLVTYTNAYKDILEVFKANQKRIEYVLSNKEKGNLNLEVKLIYTRDIHNGFFELPDLNEDINYWLNMVYCNYYGLESIKTYR